MAAVNARSTGVRGANLRVKGFMYRCVGRASQAVDVGLLRSRHGKGVFFQLGLDSWSEELPVKHAFYAEV